MKSNEVDKSILRQLASEIRDEYKIAANTAYRVGYALMAIIEALPEIEDLREVFLSRDKEDSTAFLLKLLGGIEVGDFIDSMLLGKGAAIDADGNAQFESVKVRGPLQVLEVIFNKLSAVGGDLVMTESGMIEHVSAIDEKTFRLFIRKDYDADIHQFQVGDVLRGIVNNLSNGEMTHSWSRVISTNTSNNSITVVTYPDEEVPSDNNSEPVKDMVLHRWGNAINADRQSTWYISSPEGRIVFLDKVVKPILDDENYASFWGKPVRLDKFKDLPINYDQTYGWMRGLIVQDLFRLRYDGTIERTIIDCGPWESERTYTDGSKHPYEQHDVWHLNCRWRAIVPEATEEPSWNSTQWAFISGDTSLRLDITSDAPLFYRANSSFTAQLESAVYRGGQDITSTIADADWSWTRDSGNLTADNAWAIKHKDTTSLLSITQDDMEDAADYVKFKCTAFVRDGSEVTKTDKEIII